MMHNLRLAERRWNTCPQCGNRGFRLTLTTDVQCLSCHHVWNARPSDYGQASKKAKPTEAREGHT